MTLWTVDLQAPLSMGFSRHKYSSGLPFPPPGDVPDSGVEPVSPTLQVDSLTIEPSVKPLSSKLDPGKYKEDQDSLHLKGIQSLKRQMGNQEYPKKKKKSALFYFRRWSRMWKKAELKDRRGSLFLPTAPHFFHTLSRTDPPGRRDTSQRFRGLCSESS